MPAVDNLGLAPGYHVAARLESMATTAVHAPVVAVIEYNYERDGEVIVPAGAVRYDTMTVGGRFMERFLAELHFDTFFLGADAIDLRLGLSTFNEEEAQKNAAMIRASDRVVVLADSSKFGTPSLHRICDIRKVSIIVTDTDVDPVLVQELEALGVAVHCVDARTGQRGVARRKARS